MKRWGKLPEKLKTIEVRGYYDLLSKKKIQLAIKRGFDVFASILLLVILSPVMLIFAIAIRIDSPGPAIFRQTRVTQYGREFKIWKFRTMVNDADKKGGTITQNADPRITRLGAKMRDIRIDELPQLFNVAAGDMSFVGARPEVPQYVDRYTPEMAATLLMRAGITCEASIQFKGEAEILARADDVDDVYVNTILPEKMSYNLQYLREFSIWRDLSLMFKTVFAVLR